MKKNKVLLNITSVFCFIYGAIYCFSLMFIPIGVYCFAAGKLFSSKADHLLDSNVADRKTVKIYMIIASIFCFPFGLLSVIAYFGIYGNNVKVENTNTSQNQAKTEESTETIQTKEESQIKTDMAEETYEEKMEKLEKLKKFREKDIITEEEFEMAKEQMFGKADKNK